MIKFNTIFWKIFFSYWLVMILIMAATGVAVALLLDNDHREFQRRMSNKFQASTALTLYESGGVEALQRWLSKRPPRHLRHTFFIDNQGRDLLGKPVPHYLLDAEGDRSIKRGKHDRSWVVQKVVGANGEAYTYASLMRPPRRDTRIWGMGFLPPFRSLFLTLALLVTGGISYLLARHITSPVRMLRSATRRIADGNLSTRVAADIGGRRDELGELGRDFDRMAVRIEGLLTTQKRMLRDVSHELRSPLARLQVALELARKSAQGSAEEEHRRIEREVVRLDELIGQVLALVRLESQSRQVETEPVKLIELVREAAENADFEAKSTNKSVDLLGGEDMLVAVNGELIYSALENILRNAVRYTSEAKAVQVAVARQDNRAVVSIRDYGPGVSEAALPHLFEPFYREAEARDRKSGGYGLGMAIAERAVKLHGGDIAAANAEGGGLEVTIRLPLG